jgi:glycosyltransferase involved in cell wall biosynthesis
VKVTVITVVLNNKDYLEHCLESVLSQNYPDIEHILVDGGSTDGTLEIVFRYEKHLSKWISEPDKGLYDAMNKGLAMATGDVVGTLNSDDYYADSKILEKVVRTMSDFSVEACYGDLVYVDRQNPNRIVRYWQSRPFTSGLFKTGWAPPHPTFFVRRSTLETYGTFDLRYRLAADFELLARLLEHYKIRTCYIPEVIIKMRMGGVTNRSIANIISQNLEILRACKENHIKVSFFRFIAEKLLIRHKQFKAGLKYHER